jgi:hypothetical protein
MPLLKKDGHIHRLKSYIMPVINSLMGDALSVTYSSVMKKLSEVMEEYRKAE